MNLQSNGMFSQSDMNTLRAAIASMDISAPESIQQARSGASTEYLEDSLSRVFIRLTEIIREDSQRPELSRLVAQSHENQPDDFFINVSAWLHVEEGAQATVWSYTVRRKSSDIFCLSVL